MTRHAFTVQRVVTYRCANRRCDKPTWQVVEGKTEGMMTCPNCNTRRPVRPDIKHLEVNINVDDKAGPKLADMVERLGRTPMVGSIGVIVPNTRRSLTEHETIIPEGIDSEGTYERGS